MDKKILYAILSIFLGVIIILFSIDPMWASIGAINENIKAQRDQITEIEALLEKRHEMESKYQQHKEEADEVFMALPSEDDIPYLISQFSFLAVQNGLLLESVNFSKIETSKDSKSQKQGLGFSNIPATINISGSYEAFKSYLKDLEDSLRAMRIYKIDISPLDADSSQTAVGLLFNFTLGINIYYQ